MYFDTSALAKRYVTETGSRWVAELTVPASGHDVVISRITRVELISAVTRRERGGSLSAAGATTARAHLLSHCVNEYLVLRIQEGHFALAEKLAEKHALRAYDAMQLAVAVDLNAQFLPPDFVFVSADDELNAAAAAEGLTFENPNHHP
ncbi:MAG: type II toxin-antitoxin system VapC family toxin [Roseimicrobium sp.]